jgi:hypothetical protein
MIEIISKKEAGKGKSEILIEKCVANNGVFVVSDDRRKETVIKKAKNMGLVLKNIVTVHELFYKNMYDTQDLRQPFYYEDVHILIKNLFPDLKIGAMSIDTEEENE